MEADWEGTSDSVDETVWESVWDVEFPPTGSHPQHPQLANDSFLESNSTPGGISINQSCNHDNI